MYYVNFTAANKDYRLRLNTANTVQLEKALGGNPLCIFEGERLPSITEMVAVLYNSLQPLNHGISLADAYNIFDAYLADGHAATEFIPVILEVYKASGIIKGDSVSVNEVDEKN
jgi:hypothetical protein